MRVLIIGAICLLAATLFLVAFYYNRKRQRAIEEAGIVFTDGDSSGGSGGLPNSSGTNNTPAHGSGRSGSSRSGSSGRSSTPNRRN
jgi:hypothetical protein